MALNRIAFDIRIKCFIADTPARAAIKCVKGHTDFNACEKCIIRGQTIQIQGKADSVDHVSLWKATRFYFFLLYSGPFIMKHVFSEALYKHFLLLVAAFRILCSKKWAVRYHNFAKRYLRKSYCR